MQFDHTDTEEQETSHSPPQDTADMDRYIQDQAEAYNDRAIEFFEQGQFDEAITEWRRAIEVAPEIAELHHNLGNALAKSGELRQAIEAWEQAIQLDSELVEAYNNLGYAYYKLDDLQEAYRYWDRAVRIDPNCAEAQRNLQLLRERLVHLAFPDEESLDAPEGGRDGTQGANERRKRVSWWQSIRNRFRRRGL